MTRCCGCCRYRHRCCWSQGHRWLRRDCLGTARAASGWPRASTARSHVHGRTPAQEIKGAEAGAHWLGGGRWERAALPSAQLRPHTRCAGPAGGAAPSASWLLAARPHGSKTGRGKHGIIMRPFVWQELTTRSTPYRRNSCSTGNAAPLAPGWRSGRQAAGLLCGQNDGRPRRDASCSAEERREEKKEEETSGHVAGSPCRRMDCQVWLQHAWPLNRLCTHKVTPSAACLHTGAAALSAGVTGHQKLTK